MVVAAPSIVDLLPTDLVPEIVRLAQLSGRPEREVVIDMVRGAIALWRREPPPTALLTDGPPSMAVIEGRVLWQLRQSTKPMKRRRLQAVIQQELGPVQPWRVRNALYRLMRQELVRRGPGWGYEAVPIWED